jgi:hypothetical protein
LALACTALVRDEVIPKVQEVSSIRLIWTGLKMLPECPEAL